MNKANIWYCIIWIIVILAALKYFPRAGYGLAAITILVLLLRLRGKNARS